MERKNKNSQWAQDEEAAGIPIPEVQVVSRGLCIPGPRALGSNRLSKMGATTKTLE